MSTTRKILLGVAILVGCFALFQVYDLTAHDFAAQREADVARNRKELAALEAREAPASGPKLGERERAARIEDLRSWIKSGEETTAMDRERAKRRWWNAIIALLAAGGIAAAVVLMGRKDGPQALVRLGQVRPGVVVAAIVALIAGLSVISFTRALIGAQDEVASSERRLDEVKAKLDGFKFDASGNIAKDQQVDFQMTLSEAEYAPQAVAQARGNRTIDAAILLGSAVALGLSTYLGRRSWKRSFGPAPAMGAS